jgi:hypothetical protein
MWTTIGWPRQLVNAANRLAAAFLGAPTSRPMVHASAVTSDFAARPTTSQKCAR